MQVPNSQSPSGLGTTRQGYHLGSQTFETKPVKVENLEAPKLSPSGLGMVFNGRILTESGPVAIKDLVIDFDPKETTPDGTPVTETHYWDEETFSLLQAYGRSNPELVQQFEAVFAQVRENQNKSQ